MIFYFDNAATTKIKPEVLNAMMPYLTEEYGNPSSLYSIGRRAKRAINNARAQVADLINCNKNEIYFTGCGSESDNTAIKGIASAYKNKGNHIITSKIEHKAILESCKTLEKNGFDITYINVDEEGLINLQELENAITDKTILISIMFANNEIGTIEPIKQISKIAKQRDIIFHTDAVQAVGNVPIDVKELGIDMLSMSGHKIYAPKGIGALYVRNGIKFDRYMDGGHQERNKRAGTENLASIVGLGKACEIAKTNLFYHAKKQQELRDYYIEEISKNIKNIENMNDVKDIGDKKHMKDTKDYKEIKDNKEIKDMKNIKDIKINGSMIYRLPGNANISFVGVDATALLLELDKVGICCSAGSACNSGEASPSHVLTAIGLNSDQASSALRVTFGDYNTKLEVDYLVQNIKQIIEKLTN